MAFSADLTSGLVQFMEVSVVNVNECPLSRKQTFRICELGST